MGDHANYYLDSRTVLDACRVTCTLSVVLWHMSSSRWHDFHPCVQ